MLLTREKLIEANNNVMTIIENRVMTMVGCDRQKANLIANEVLNIETQAETLKTGKKPLAIAVRIYQGDNFPMADIRTSPCDGSKLETIVWTNVEERNRFDYNGYTLFYDTRTYESFHKIDI